MILRYVIFTLIGTSALLLATTHIITERWWLAAFVAASAILWGVGFWRGIQWSAGLGLVIFSVAAALGLNDGNPLWLMFIGMLLAFAAWDLTFFSETLDEAEVLDSVTLYRIHFNRLGIVIVSGLVLSGIMFAFQFNLRPVWAIFIGLFVIYGLSRTIRFLRQASD